MEGRLQPSTALSASILSLQQQQSEARLQFSSRQRYPSVQPYSLIVGQNQRSLLDESASRLLASNISTGTVRSPTPGVLVHASSFKQESQSSPFDPHYGGAYSVERLLQQQASSVVDAKPTISPALLSAVDLISATQEPLQALQLRQQEQLAVAQHHLALSGSSSLLSPARTALLHEQADSPLAGLHSSLQPLLNTPPPPVVASPQLQLRRATNTDVGTPLPQLNNLVRSIDRRLGNILIPSPVLGGESQAIHFADHRLFRLQEPQDGLSQQLNRFGIGAPAIISPRSLSPSLSSGGGSEHQGASFELGGVKEESSRYQGRPVSPLRGRGRPSANPVVDGSPRQHPCPECGKAFPNNSALVKHRLIHSDERNFICNICQKAFKRQDHLNGHLNVHKTVKPFPCIIGNCDKSYCDARSLRRHLEHSHNVQNPVVHSSKGTVYIKCDDLEATVLPNRNVEGEGSQSVFNLGETNSSSTVAGQEFATDVDAFGVSADNSPDSDQHCLVSPTTGLEFTRRSSSKPVDCVQCGRSFKNMPALNGHMRLHSVSTRTENTRTFEDMSKTVDHTALPVFPGQPMSGGCHSGHSSSAPGSTPISGTSPVDAMLQQQRHQQALAHALAESASAPASYQNLQQHEQIMDHEYNIHHEFRPTRPGPGLLMYAPSQQHPGLHQQSQQHGTFHVSDAQVQTAHDYASPMSSRPPSHCSTQTTGAYVPTDRSQQQDLLQHCQHQQNHGFVSLLTVNTSALQDATGRSDSMLSGSDDPTMMSPHLGSLTGLDVSASPDLTLKPSGGPIVTGSGAGLQSGPMAPMLGGPSVVDSPYCSSLRAEEMDVSGQRPVNDDFGFAANYAGVDIPSSSTSGTHHLSMHHAVQHQLPSSGAAGVSCQMEGPLDLGPELSKDVDDELIQKELLSFMRFPGPGDGMFNPFDDDDIFGSPAKLSERKRHMTAPSVLASGSGGYSLHYSGSSTNMDHHYDYQQQSMAPFAGYGLPKSGSILGNFEHGETAPSSIMGSGGGGPMSANAFASSTSEGQILSTQFSNAAMHCESATSSGNHNNSANGSGKKSRPASRQRRKSRGKPDNVFMLLKNVGLRRSFNLSASPPRFRKHSAILTDSSRKFSNGNGSGGHHGGGGTSTKCHHRSGGSLHQRHANRPKPAPLLIPGVTLNRFHSQLRSPRLWSGTGLSGCASYAKSGYSTPTPYTPPPILSPVRYGSGLFWTISKALAAFAGPKSAPISPRFGRGFWPKGLPPIPPSTEAQGGFAGFAAASGGSPAVGDCVGDGPYSGIASSNLRVISPLDISLTEDADGQPPATDTTPHINIGFQYQAEIPEMRPVDIKSLESEPEMADLLFSPAPCEHLDDDEVDAFCKLASSIVMSGSGRNVEYAMHLLNAVSGDLERAYFLLLSPDNGRGFLQAAAPSLSNYEYVDTCLWSCEEIMKFQEAIIKHDKDFYMISSMISTKTVKRCVQFYYTWKKMCTDEYKRLRAARRRRILPAMALEPNVYDLRSLGPIETIVPSAAVGSPFTALSSDQQVQEPADAMLQSNLANSSSLKSAKEEFGGVNDFVEPAEKNGHANTGMFNKLQFQNEVEPVLMKTYNTSPYRASPAAETGSTSDTIFPCRLCGKVFYKVKSRNAHMKSHSIAGTKKGSPMPGINQ